MKKFNRNYVAGQTKVQLSGEYGYRLVSDVDSTRNWIKVEGLTGSFQVGHVNTYTNKSDVNMYPAVEDMYTSDQYGSVYKRGENANIFVGKLNGRSLKRFVEEYEETV